MVQLAIKSIDLVYMNDPSISSFTRTLYHEETEEYGEMNLHDYMFAFGVVFIGADKNPIHLPESVGRMITKNKLPLVRDGGVQESIIYDSVPCA